MGQDLISNLAPRLKGLEKGGYLRGYRSGERSRKSGTHKLVGDLLDSLRIPYQEDAAVGLGSLRADFKVNGTFVFVDRDLSTPERKRLASKGIDILLVKREAQRSDREDHGIRILGLEEKADVQTIFLDDQSFNFDYAHILPKTQKCSVMHGHTSSVLVEVAGTPIEGMVVDFGDAKQIVREAVRGLDHKLFINKKYVTGSNTASVSLKFETVHGPFEITAPKATTVLLEGEATVENLAREVLSRIAPKMPKNVTMVGVYVYEGLNKGSHVLARIHSGRAETGRRKR